MDRDQRSPASRGSKNSQSPTRDQPTRDGISAWHSNASQSDRLSVYQQQRQSLRNQSNSQPSQPNIVASLPRGARGAQLSPFGYLWPSTTPAYGQDLQEATSEDETGRRGMREPFAADPRSQQGDTWFGYGTSSPTAGEAAPTRSSSSQQSPHYTSGLMQSPNVTRTAPGQPQHDRGHSNQRPVNADGQYQQDDTVRQRQQGKTSVAQEALRRQQDTNEVTPYEDYEERVRRRLERGQTPGRPWMTPAQITDANMPLTTQWPPDEDEDEDEDEI